MINPYILLAVVIAWGATLGGAGWIAYGAGRDAEIADRVSDEDLARKVAEAAQQGAADEIAKLKPQHTTIVRNLEKEVRTVTDYSKCRHSADGMRAITEAFTGADASGQGDVRLPDTAAGGYIRSNEPGLRASRDNLPRVFSSLGDREK